MAKSNKNQSGTITINYSFSNKKTTSKINKDRKDYIQYHLNRLIKVTVPDWVDVEQYKKLLSQFEKLRKNIITENSINSFRDWILSQPDFGLQEVDISSIDVKDGSVESKYGFKPKQLLQKYNDGMMFSTPETGQDPKGVTPFNIKDAEYYAGTQWGSEKSNSWERSIYINTVVYPHGNGNSNIVFSVVDGEHRVWGIVGFQLDVVRLKAPDGETLIFFQEDKMVKPINVDGLYLSDIVEISNKNLKNDAPEVTKSDVLNRFNKHSVPVKFLPMFDEVKCSKTWTRLNKQSENSKAQDLHADALPANKHIKSYSSIKCAEFPGSVDEMDEFLDLFTESDKIELKTYMIAHLVVQYLMKGGFVPSQDNNIVKAYYDSNGYENWYEQNKENVKEALKYLYELFKHLPKELRNSKYISRQRIQLALKMRDFFRENRWATFDYEQLMMDYTEFIDRERLEDDGTKSKFGTSLSQSGVSEYDKCWKHIVNGLFTNPSNGKSIDDLELGRMGIKQLGEELPRYFSKRIIEKSLRKYKYLDIDNKTKLNLHNCVGGHIIAHDVLKKLSDAERDELARIEGFKSGKFTFEENCRPMSKELNNLQGTLPLSKFIPIMNKAKEIILEHRRNYTEEIEANYNLVS
jgi:hypothetical protein